MQKNDYPKLREYPFCGGKAALTVEFSGKEKRVFVRCKACDVKTSDIWVSERYCANDEARKAWNRRIDNE